tara:strand:+ start:457 stop:822 length:366 start_codon:yes stop_codon:yes gene_type:complete
MKTQEQFIIDTLLPYKEDPETRAVNENEYCMYLTDDNRKCAVGQHLKKGEWQRFIGDVSMVDEEYDIFEILTDEAKEQNLSVEDWGNIQNYHDNFNVKVAANKSLKILEKKLNINLGVLYL